MLFNLTNSLTENPSMELRSENNSIPNSHTSATRLEALDDSFDSSTHSCPYIIHAIVISFTFLVDMGRSKGLIKSKQSL